MKKFIIAMLCVAVLFGFAACDNSSNAPSGSEGLDKLVVSMKVEAKTGFDGKYFDGEKIDLSNYVITATTYNGDEVEVAAADVSLDKDKVSAGDNEDVKSTLLATLTYKGATYGAIPVKAECPNASEKNAILLLTIMVPNTAKMGVTKIMAINAFFIKVYCINSNGKIASNIL